MTTPSGQRHIWHLAFAITTCAAVFTIMQGLTYPLLALILNRMDVPEWLIGINAATMPIGMILSAPLAPHLMRRFGGYHLTIASLVISAACLLAIKLLVDPWLWMPLRLLMGIALGCILVVNESWINQIATDAHRGRIIGFYSAVLSAGFALGPALLAVVSSRGWAPFLIGAALPLLALLPLLAVRGSLPTLPAGARTVPVLAFLRMAPLLLVLTAAVALADEGAMSFLPIYALAHGYAEKTGTILLIVMIAGSVSLQYPIGWVADRVPRATVMIACAAAAAVSAAVMPLTVATPWLFVFAVFGWGGVYYAIYMLALVRLGESFSGMTLVTGNAAFAAMWGVGGIAGSSVVGGAMSAFGPVGYPLVFALTFGIIALALLVNQQRTRA
ncbi:MAG: MFS transporter [Halofilum sp. (in: g-proteobacteria)]